MLNREESVRSRLRYRTFLLFEGFRLHVARVPLSENMLNRLVS